MLTAFDKKLLNVLQAGLPISSRPFADLAQEVDSDEITVLERVRFLKKEGYLRRIGPFFDSEKMGYKGTLVALRVIPEFMKSVVEVVNRYPGTTHNYERNGKYNLWFTLLTPNENLRQNILGEIASLPGVEAILNLASHKKYKVNVQFNLK
ncbi:Lrp/AsnC family transcriptional regulator [Selenomonas sputigena]|uniref:siroheme decarboxylase n=1 Tax=Selenomonas sputigena TaxID=69823 RepID=A0ABV3X4A0_9FIRM